MKAEIGFNMITNRYEHNVVLEDFDLWNLDSTLAVVILPALRAFKRSMQGAPFVANEDLPEHLQHLASKLSIEEMLNGGTDEFYHARWEAIIDEMIYAFEMIHPNNEESETEIQAERIREGLKLFGKYFRNLWT